LLSLFVAANVSGLVPDFLAMPVRQPRHQQEDAKENCENCENYQPMENTELAHVTSPSPLNPFIVLQRPSVNHSNLKAITLSKVTLNLCCFRS